MTLSRTLRCLSVLIVLALVTSARADELTALGRVRAVGPGPGVSAALSSGYGFTGAVLRTDDQHHRASGALGLAVRALPWLELTGAVTGRYDRHTGDSTDDGFVGDPRLGVTLHRRLGDADALGLRLGVWLPGADAPSIETSATTVDAAVVYTRTAGALAITATAGFRLDNSTESVDAASLSPADRLGLGLSDANAALVGLGVAHRRGATSLFGELSGEVLVGDRAPAALESPLRIGAGVRRAIADALTLEALVEVGLSQRPDLMALPHDQLIDVEPRLAIAIGLSWRPAAPTPRAVVIELPPPVEPPPVEPPPPPAPTTGPLTGTVVDDGGSPLPDTTITVGTVTIMTGEDGTFTVADLPAGEVTVGAERGGYQPFTGTVTIVAGPGAQLPITLVRVVPKSQIRGLVRDFGGKGLVAKIRIEPLGLDVTSAADGTFAVDAPPGTYTVTVTAAGYRSQKKTALVVDGGVAILNLELVKGRP